MWILERSARSAPPPAESGERLRVITAGRVGNMEARLGTSGFDVIAVAETEHELMIAVAADEPDAIVVEADLCDSLESVRELAPDAVLLVIGDRTPAGAIGRIERGVTGTVMAGLLHALVAEGLGAAVPWGLIPAPQASGSVPAAHAGSMMLTKAQLVGGQLARGARAHASVAAAATTVAVGVSAAIVLVAGPPRIRPHAGRTTSPVRAVRVVEPHAAANLAPAIARPSRAHAADRRPHRDRPGIATGPAVRPTNHGHHAGRGGGGDRPPGIANGWDHRPPKHEDDGKREGWTKGKGPQDTSGPRVGEGRATRYASSASDQGYGTSVRTPVSVTTTSSPSFTPWSPPASPM
jgi:hypothetical protein